MSEKIHPSELFHIWKCEPCQSGDTLSGGENTANLKRLGLVKYTELGYITTSKGKYVIQRMIEHLDKLEVCVIVDITVVTPSNIKQLKHKDNDNS